MEKKLPNVFANKIDKKIENNRTVSVTKEDEAIEVSKELKGNVYEKNINQKIQEIFSSTKYVYKADVVITMKDKTITKKVIGKNGNYLITIDNELIPISEIANIEYEK